MNTHVPASVFVFSILVILLTWLLIKAHAGQDVSHYQDVLKSVNFVKNSLAGLNQEEYKIQAGVKKDYDKLGDMTNNILRYSRKLKEEIQLRPEDLDKDIIQITEQLDFAITNKIQLVDRFIEKHAILRNSLDYFPIMAMHVKSETGSGLISGYIRNLEQSLMYFLFTNDISWYAKSIDLLETPPVVVAGNDDKTNTHIRNYFAHARYILEGRRELSLALNETNNAAILGLLDSLQVAYENKLSAAQKVTDRYRLYIYMVSVMLVGLIAYVTFLWSRNALALWGEQQKAHVTLASIGDGVIVTDKNGCIEYLNSIAEHLTGWKSKECTGMPLEEVFRVYDEKNRQSLNECIRKCLFENKLVERGENTILVTRSNREINIEHSVAPINDKKQRVNGAIIVFSDISEKRRMSRAIEWQATHDMLTGLVNRLEFENRLNEALITAKQDKKEHGLLYIDLDHFKIVNDTCGHLAGDELLKQVVNLIKKNLRQGDTFARLGGDEFAVLLPYCHLLCAEGISESLLDALKKFRFLWEEKSFRIGASIGIVPVTSNWQDVVSMLSAADVACYAAKEAGRDRIHIYEETDQGLAQRRTEMQWVSRILDALNENQFQIHSQPIVPLQGSSSARVLEEILIRMVDEDGSIISPGAFIPAAERYKLMPVVDRWVIHNVFQYYSTGRRHGCIDSILSINLSGSSLNQAQIVDYIKEQMNCYAVNPKRICFEITETEAIANLNETSYLISSLRELGFQFALDDFGSGMASFSYLKTLPVDYIKIDGHIIKDVLKDEVSHLMVEMIVQLARAMGIITIAEFVENEALIPELRQIGIDYAQGFACGKPQAYCELQSDLFKIRQFAG